MIDKNITMNELKQSLLRGALCDAILKRMVSSKKAHMELNSFNFPFQDFEPIPNVFWTEQALTSLKQVIGFVWSQSSLEGLYAFEKELLNAEHNISKTYPTDNIEWNDIEEKHVFKTIDFNNGVSMIYFKSGQDNYIAYIWNNETLEYAMEQFQRVIEYRNQNY